MWKRKWSLVPRKIIIHFDVYLFYFITFPFHSWIHSPSVFFLSIYISNSDSDVMHGRFIFQLGYFLVTSNMVIYSISKYQDDLFFLFQHFTFSRAFCTVFLFSFLFHSVYFAYIFVRKLIHPFVWIFFCYCFIIRLKEKIESILYIKC